MHDPLLLVGIFLMALTLLPSWGFHDWGYGPSSALGAVLVALLIIALIHRI